MKQYFINFSLSIIKSYFKDYNSNKLDQIKYGLEAIYISITKTLVILLLSFILNIFKETIIILIMFNLLRMFAFGIHAKKSWQCWISSLIFFIGIPYLSIYLNMNNIYLLMIIVYAIFIYILYAPSDTIKRPLVNKRKRYIYKILTIIISIIYIIIFLTSNSVFIKNSIAFTMLLESVLIHPLTYRVFKLPYKNYKRYVFSK